MQNQENNLREMTPLKVNTFDLNSTSLIEASAGTGKTYTISNLVIRLLLGQLNKDQNSSSSINQGNPLSIENILIVTFTNAAASDLRARILEKIHDTRILFETVGKGASLVSLDCDENLKELLENYLNSENQQDLAKKYARLLNRAERNIDNAPISTIHSFCNRALNQVYAFESGKAFNVQLIQEQESNALQDEAMFAVWRELFYTDKLGDKRATLLEILGTQDPTSLKDTIKLLKSVRNLNPKDGYFGYAIYNLKKQHPNNTLEKELTDLIKAYEKIIKELLEGENADLLWQIHECFKKHTVVTESNQSPFYESVTGFTDEIYALFTNIEDLKDLETEDFNKELVKLLFASGKATKKILSKGNDNISLISRAIKDSRFKKLPLEAQEFEENLYQLVNNLEEVRDKLDLNSKTIWYVLSILCINKLDSLFIRDNVISNDELLRQLAIVLTVDKKRGDNLAKLLRNQYPVAMIDEFQDTDPIQFEIFNKLYLEDKKQEQSKAVCYLIGDPKQSIYAFRNADINSYNKAKAKVEKLYTLDTNFRSSRNIIEGVNAIFEQDVPGFEARPLDCEADFIPSNIDFMRVNYPKEDKKLAGSCRFYFDDEYNDDDFYKRPISNYVNTIEFEKSESNKDQYQVAIAKALACDVVKVLTHGILDKSSDRTKKRKIKPSDIAILVKSGQESSKIQDALEEVGLKSVYFSDRSSVIGGDVQTSYCSSEYKPSCESVNIIYFMEAMCNNSNVSLVNRLLTCSLLRDNSKEIVLNTEDDNFDKEIRLLHDCYLKWEKHGFISAFTHYLQSHNGIKSMLDTEGGERALSNYYQIAELIQSIDAKVIGPQAQLIWFKSVALESDSKNACFSEDETKKHLESEQELIKIYTVHMSKGLQYPIVFLPYFYLPYGKEPGGSQSSNFKIYDVNSAHLTIVPNNETFYLQMDEKTNTVTNMSLTSDFNAKEKTKDAKEIAKQASLQEEVRLLYVALTRAQAANFIYLNNLTGSNYKVFNRIINPKAEDGTLKAVSNLDLFKPLYKEHLKADELLEDSSVEACKKEYKDYLAKEKALNNKETSSLSVNTLNAGDIDKSYTISSYSTITSGNHNHMFTEQNGENLSSDPKVQVEDSPSAELLQFTFTKGNIAGDFLHELMEYLLSRTNFDKNDDGCLLKFVEETTQNKKYGSLLKPYDQDISTFNADFTDWLSSIVHANLGIVDSNSHPLSLSCLTSDKCACELEYFMPSKLFKMDEFNLICDEFYQSEVKKFGDAIQADLPMLKAKDFKGFMKGSIDLVANFETDIGNQYFLIDYKSNFLGGDFKDYSPSQMFKSIFTSRYDVQILIYSVAL
ncbi:MAG: UvrD-helicase domain-containing protein, partial [Succinivibrio sp.]|nr:UvrD-helicase domain-containing protein [Succinivibrio sp.]